MLARALAQHEETGRASAALRAPRPPTTAGGQKFARVCGPSTPCGAAQRCAAPPPPAGIAPQIARVPQHAAARLLFATLLPPLLPSPLPPRATTPPTCRSQAIADRPFPCAVPHHTTPRRAHARAHARARFAVHPRVVVNALTGSLLHLRHQDAPGVVPDQEGGGYVRRERGLRSGGCGAICAWIPPCARSAALRLRAAGLPPQAATTPGLCVVPGGHILPTDAHHHAAPFAPRRGCGGDAVAAAASCCRPRSLWRRAIFCDGRTR